MRRAGALTCLVLALGLLGYWYVDGPRLATLTKKPVETTVVDDFGDEETRIVWEETFDLGLDLAGPVVAGLLALAGLLWFLDKRARNRPPVL